jgi:hypothetical protein
MKRKSSHRPSQKPRPLHATLVLLSAAMFIAVGLRGTGAAATCTAAVFSGASFTVDDLSTGRGSGTASVSGCDGEITGVSVTLTFTNLPRQGDLDLLLVHPDGVQNLVFFSDVGPVSGPPNHSSSSFTGTITVADTGAICLPEEDPSASALVSGTTYKPTDYAVNIAGNEFDDFDPGAPATKFSAGQGCTGAAGPHSFVSAFHTLSANGTWTLYAYDDLGFAPVGNYQVSWSLTITTITTEARVETFTATPFSAGGVQIHWRTGYEIDNLGFNIYRDYDGQRTKLNPSLIAGSALLAGPGTALTAGQSYVWWDDVMSGSKGARYWLEAIDLSGQRTWHGPAALDGAAPSSLIPPSGQAQAVLLSRMGQQAAHQARAAPMERRMMLSTLPTGPSVRQALLAARPTVRLWVRQEGWYRVTYPELVAAGLHPGADPRLLQLYVEGREIPIRVSGQEDGRFDPGDAIEFYGLGLDESWTDARVYWLVDGARAGKRIPLISTPDGQVTGTSFPFTVEQRERTVYFSSLRNGDGENFFGAVVSQEPVVASLPVQHLDLTPAGPTLLEVTLQGVTAGAHRVQVALNGASVGELTFQGQNVGMVSLPIAPSGLRAGENRVELTAQAGEGDISLIDAIRLTYWHTYAADDDVLRFSATGQQRVTITGFSSAAIRVLDITDADAVLEISGEITPQGSGYAATLTVPGSGPRALLALTPEQAKPVAAITANQPSRWRQAGQGADLVIISHRDFINSMEPLKARRQSQGLQVAVVDIADVFDEFSYGHKTPYAVRDFLRHAVAEWTPGPRFVLLVGDASLDPKDYLGFGAHDLIPTKLIDTAVMETASDEWLADLDGDGLAELAVGRLPARTAQEAERLLAKITDYERAGTSAGVLLVADHDDAFDFAAANEQLRVLIPADVAVEEIDRGQMDDTAAMGQLLESLNRGPALVNYTGHGSVDLWRGHLLTAEDARELSNGERLSVFVTMTCLNAYFHDAALESLAEALMNAEGGGAVAVWAPSGMTGPSGQAAMNRELYRLLFTDSSPQGTSWTLGEAAVRAKTAVGNDDIRRTWILLGDPTMLLRVR